MSENVIQTSFAAGELAPSIYARTDLTKYKSGAALLRNFFVDYRSGASTRAGTRFIKQALISSKPVRLIPFQSSVLVPYILEFGDFYMMPISNGAAVTQNPMAITGISQANPAVLTIPGATGAIVAGNQLFLTGILGMTNLNGRFFNVLSVVGNSVAISDVNGNPINSTGYAAYISGGSAQTLAQFASPYAAADLQLLKFVQVANVMYLTHPNYPPTALTFNSPTSWTFTTLSFVSTIPAPTGLSTSTSTAGSSGYNFVVTAVDANGQESAPSAVANLTSAVNIFATAGTISVSWAAVTGATAYNVYMNGPVFTGGAPAATGPWGFLGSTTGTTFQNSNINPNFTFQPPVLANPFASGNNPGTACFFQQRLYYAGSTAFPQTFWASQPGSYNNFNISNPIQPADAITGTIVSKQVNFIKSMQPMPGGLILLTANGAWQLSSGQGAFAASSAVTPINATAAPQAYNGVSDVPPIVVNNDLLYVQSKGSIVRNLLYNIYANVYTGTDISVLSNHLFFQHQILQWTYAEEPFKVIWAVRDDGILLSLTFVKEQEMTGWARHDTAGTFTSVASVQENVGQPNASDAVYFAVQRFIGGQFVTYIERMADRFFPYGVEDAWCVDSGVQSSLNFPSANLVITGQTPMQIPGPGPLAPGGPTLVATGTITATASTGVFNSGSVGQILRVGGGVATVTTFVSTTQVQAMVTQPITSVEPSDPNATPLPALAGNWSLTPQFTTFQGLDYLNGQTVQVLADGNVYPPQTVVNGQITLPQAASKVTVGLAFLPQLQTLYLDVAGQETIQGKRKKISAVSIRVANARGLSAGRTWNTLVPIKEANALVPPGAPVPLISYDERVLVDPLFDVPGQICVQQSNPLPATVLGIIHEVMIGDTR